MQIREMSNLEQRVWAAAYGAAFAASRRAAAASAAEAIVTANLAVTELRAARHVNYDIGYSLPQ